MPPTANDPEIMTQEEFQRRSAPRRERSPVERSDYNFVIEEEIPGPPELLPTRMPDIGTPRMVESRARAAINLAGSVVSEDGQVLPPLKKSNRGPMRRAMSQPDIRVPQYQTQKSSLGPQQIGTPQPEQHFEPHHSMSQPPPEFLCSAHTPQYQQDIQYPIQNEAPQHQPEMFQYTRNEVPRSLPEMQQPGRVATPLLPVADPVLALDSAPPVTTNAESAPEVVVLQVPELATSTAPTTGPAPHSRPTSRSGMKVRTASMGSLTLPQIPASDPVLHPSSLQRSQTWSEVPHQYSEFPMSFMQDMQHMQHMPHGMSFHQPPPSTNGLPYNKTLQSKKALIRQKLEDAIARGQMPPYCANCGAIETPTWRKAWSQDLQGVPGYHEYSDAPGRVTAIIILARNDENIPTSYKLVKKFLGKEEKQEDFDEYILCNRKSCH